MTRNLIIALALTACSQNYEKDEPFLGNGTNPTDTTTDTDTSTDTTGTETSTETETETQTETETSSPPYEVVSMLRNRNGSFYKANWETDEHAFCKRAYSTDAFRKNCPIGRELLLVKAGTKTVYKSHGMAKRSHKR